MLRKLLLVFLVVCCHADWESLVEKLVNKGETELQDLLRQANDYGAGMGAVVMDVTQVEVDVGSSTTYRPVVQMHGMGDYAKNPLGMEPLRRLISKHLNGTYVTNVQIGKTWYDDWLNTFLMPLNQEVEHFAATVRKDPHLKNGFNAVGYSQGNLVVRGYVERYNDPPIYNWLSVHGPLAGVAGFPQCNYTAEICRLWDNFLGDLAYESFVQNMLAQANYYRDPLRIKAFNKGDLFLADVNNERATKNATYKPNFLKMNKLAVVKALKDTMVWPNESEWWGFYENGSEKKMWNMTETPWYQNDWFGLKTLNEGKRLDFHSTPGNHLKFTEKWLLKMVDLYFKN